MVELIDANCDLKMLAKIIRLSYGSDKAGDEERTIRNCFNAGHMSVFEFVDATVFVECPIYVARQLMRYRCASYLERSLRRCEPFGMEASSTITSVVGEVANTASRIYRALLDQGVKKEQARAVLPLGTLTQFYMKASFREWYHIFDERLDNATQTETREIVEEIKSALEEVAPFLVGLWNAKKTS